ncbi:hypothetical protein N9Z27_02640 [Alphaproteobacteria bacterium]|nr:hypothetical protein [Alphaproteobacteria bacterium]
MRQYKHAPNRAREEVKAILFCGFLVLAVSVFLTTAFISSGPIVLGTEMNTNGKVEYMCLGTGCENLADFSWSDK